MTEEHGGFFASLSRHFITNVMHQLTGVAVRVYAYLRTWCFGRDPSEPSPWRVLSVPRIAHALGWSDRHVRRGLRELRERGLIERRERFDEVEDGGWWGPAQRANAWRVLPDPDAPPPRVRAAAPSSPTLAQATRAVERLSLRDLRPTEPMIRAGRGGHKRVLADMAAEWTQVWDAYAIGATDDELDRAVSTWSQRWWPKPTEILAAVVNARRSAADPDDPDDPDPDDLAPDPDPDPDPAPPEAGPHDPVASFASFRDALRRRTWYPGSTTD